jgi:hypothetical protein
MSLRQYCRMLQFNNMSNLYKSINVVLIVCILFLGYKYYESNKTIKSQSEIIKKMSDDPCFDAADKTKCIEDVSNKNIKNLDIAVRKLVNVSEGIPFIATVTDEVMLKKDIVFFKDAVRGDKVLVYKNEVVLYRENTNQIINIKQKSEAGLSLEN